MVDPTPPSSVYIAYRETAEAGATGPVRLLRSEDGGDTWTDLNAAGAPWIDTTSRRMWFDARTSPYTVYTYDDRGLVVRSTDRGRTWTQFPTGEHFEPDSLPQVSAATEQALDTLRGPSGYAVQVVDADTGAAVGAAGFLTLDNLVGWMVVDPREPSTFYAATADGVYKTTDVGRTWHKASAGLGDPAVDGILVDPVTPSTLYATTSAGVLRSTNGGAAWTPILGGTGSVILAPSNPSTLYAWTTAGLFRSEDRGDGWTRLDDSSMYDPYTSYPGQLALAVAGQHDILFAASEAQPAAPGEVDYGPFGLILYRSNDAGDSWKPTGVRVSFTNYGRPLATDLRDPATIYAYGVMEDNVPHILKSIDAGATWTATDSGLPEWDVFSASLTVDPNRARTVWAVWLVRDSRDKAVHSIVRRSTDGGASWSEVKLEGLGAYSAVLRFDPSSPDTLYVLTYRVIPEVPSEALYRSTDGGATWENITGALHAESRNLVFDHLAVETAPGGMLYAATARGLFKWVPSD
jgi:hypothetical protein